MMAKNRLAEMLKSKSNDPTETPKSNPEVEFLKSQVADLQQRLQQRESASDEARLEKEAERLRAEEAALKEEADLRKTLKDMLPPASSQPVDEFSQPKELSQKELLGIMAEAVAKASEAQSKLLMSEVSKLVRGSDEKITRTQKAVVDLLAMVDVGRARSQFADFDTYKEDVGEIMQRTNLDSTEAYLLAKARRESPYMR